MSQLVCTLLSFWNSIPPFKPSLAESIIELVVEGTVCDTTNFNITEFYDAYLFETQEDFDAKLGFCTTIIGPVWIGPNFTGSFVLNNVRNITENILTWAVVSLVTNNSENYASSLLTTIQADKLISLGSLDIVEVPALKSIEMANLEYVGTHINVNSNPALSMNFPQLKNLTDIRIVGGYSR
jgi:hypothetical protein